MRGRILVVDDEPNITDLLSVALRFVDFEVTTAAKGHEALDAATTTSFDLIVLDMMLPDYDGLTVGRRLRDLGIKVPIVFLTARDATEDKIAGLGVGDDYVTKPFSLEELVARIEAVLRRVQADAAPVERLELGDLVMDITKHQVWRAGEPVSLSPTEFRLLRYLLANPDRVLSKAQILDRVWEYDFEGDANVVEKYISYLRRKLDHVEPHLIHTIRGVGYSLSLQPRP